MKKLLLILLLMNCIGHAQNYSCLQNGVKHYFTNGYGYLRGIRIDSVTTYPDSVIYYPYHTPRGYYSVSTLLDSTGGSWLGKKVIRESNGTFLFDNLWHDTIVIKTQANVGDTWTFYSDTTSLYYEADLIDQDTMTVSGTVDSVKTILITAHNASGIVTSDPADSFTIILSKNNGFVQTFDLYTFPYHAPDSVYSMGLDYYLDYVINMSTASAPTSANSTFKLTDLVDPTLAELTQWNVGDIYEYSDCNNLFEHYGATCYPVEHYYLDTITAVNAIPGGVSYTFSGWAGNFPPPFPNPLSFPAGRFDYSFVRNSGTITFDSTLVIDTTVMPEEYDPRFTTWTNLYSYIPGDTSFCSIGTLYTQLGFEFGSLEGITYHPNFEVFAGPTIYKGPLGLLNNFNSGFGSMGFDVQSQNLIYYNKGGTQCGSITIPPTEVRNINLPNTNITLSPNPAHDLLSINSTDIITNVAISNMPGQTVYSHVYNNKEVQVNVTSLPAGVYIIRINRDVVKKFVKE